MSLGKGSSESNDGWALIAACPKMRDASPVLRTFESSHHGSPLNLKIYSSRHLSSRSRLIKRPWVPARSSEGIALSLTRRPMP